MNKKILLLDDDDILDILFLILTDNGYEVRMLSCGETVFNDIKDFQPDLILMDIMLAGMDGRDIRKNIKENILTQSLPVMLISAIHDVGESLNLPSGSNDFLAKPFDIIFLLTNIEKLLAA